MDTLARAPGGQMRGAATQAMSDIVKATKQMPARRRAPPGCGPQARWRCCSLLTYRTGAPGMLVARALPAGLGASSKMYTLFPDGP